MSPEHVLQLIDLLPEPTLVVTGAGHIEAANLAVERRIGVGRARLAGRPLAEVVADNAADVGRLLRAWARTRSMVPGALTVRGEGGQPVACRCEGALLQPGATTDSSRVLLRLTPRQQAPSHFTVLNQKIADLSREIQRRRQAEEELRQQRELLQVTLNSIGDAVITADTEGRVTFLNPVAESLTGWPRGEAVGSPLAEVFRITHELTGEPAENPAALVLREGRVVGLDSHTALISRDGKERPIADSAAPIRDTAGRISGVVMVFRDVSGEREAERAVRASEERHRLITELSTDFTFSARVGPEGEVGLEMVSDGFTRMLGYTPEEVAAGGGWRGILHPDDLPAVRQGLEQLLKGQPASSEVRLISREGEVRWVRTVSRPVADEGQGRVVRLLGAAEDITERKQAEDEARRFQLLSDHANDAHFVIDWEARFLYVNRRAQELLGYSEAELLRMVVPDIDAGFPLPRFQELFDRLQRQQRVPPFETSVTRKDGSRLPFEVSVTGVPFDGQPYMFAVARDITERKQAEKAIRESERLYRAIGESIDYGVWVCTPEGRNVYASESFLRLVGLTQEECSDLGWGSVLHPDDAEDTLAAWRECVRTRGTWDREHRFLGVDGQYHPVLARGVAVRGDDGRVIYWAGINLDISRLKQAEESLREADRRKDEFLAMLAHELRNPLAPIRNALHILRMRNADASAAGQARDMMERQVQHMVRLVDDLLDVSRIMSGKIELRKEPAELAVVLARAVETAQPTIDARGHELVVELPPRPVVLQVDLVRMAQVVSNLLANAAKYTERAGRIWLSATLDGDEVVIRVRDNGVGIDPGILPHVFDPFVQAERSLHRSQGGLGVGLTLVKRLTEMHGGRVEARSAGRDQGSELVVWLPYRTGLDPGPEAAADGVGALDRRKLRVLVVDDNVDATESLATMLRLWGHEVRTAHDGPAALEIAAGYPADVVLLDIGMPGMTGHEVARRLRRMPEYRQTLLAAVTGWGQEEDRRQSRAAGFDHHFTKPVDAETLEALLAGVRLLPG